MSKLKGFLSSCALVLIASTASAQMSITISGANGSSTIPNNHIQDISLDPITNVVTIQTSEDYIVELAEPPCEVDCGDEPPTVTSFSVNTPITVGDSANISWTTSNATSCETSGYGAWSGMNIGTSGNVSIPMNSPGNYIFGLTCYNGDIAAPISTRQVLVEDEVIVNPTNACVDYQSPLNGTTVKWNDLFFEDFPNPGYANELVTIPNRYGYYAIEFDTGNFVDTGSIMTIESTITSGIRYGSISQCPGDYNVPSECQFVWGTGGSIIWSTDNYNGACDLDPNTTYYFNVTFTDGFDPTETSCHNSKCVTKVRVYNP